MVPDLFGHGESARPVGDYSLGAHAATLRDLLDRLGIEQVTLVGHSLGGGIAMVFTYLFPERVEGLVLVASGGLGREVSPLLRSATLPGAEWVLPVIASGWVHDGIEVGGPRARRGRACDPGRTPARCGPASPRWATPTPAGPSSATTRAVIDPGGQTVAAEDYLRRGPVRADPRRLGDQGPDDPRLARRRRRRRRSRTAGSSCSGGRGTSSTSTTPTASPAWCESSSPAST